MSQRRCSPIVVAIALMGLGASLYSAIAQNAEPAPSLSQPNPPNPPSTPPDYRTIPAGSSNSSNASCGSAPQLLTALFPAQNPVVTPSTPLTIFFDVPHQSEEVWRGEFSLVARDEKTPIQKCGVENQLA